MRSGVPQRNRSGAYAFTCLLSFKEFAFAGDITSITFGGHVFTQLTCGLPGNDFGAYGCLDGNIKLLARNQFFESFADFPAKVVGMVLMNQGGECVSGFAVRRMSSFTSFASRYPVKW